MSLSIVNPVKYLRAMSILNIRTSLFAVLSLLSTYSCSNDQTVYGYVVTKPEKSDVSIWRPVMRVTFRIAEDKIISEVAGLLDEYQNCTITNKNNWECQYDDDRGINKFGFDKGVYWNEPGWGNDIKYVSRWEYNLIRCKWYQHNSGTFKGTVECLQTYI